MKQHTIEEGCTPVKQDNCQRYHQQHRGLHGDTCSKPFSYAFWLSCQMIVELNYLQLAEHRKIWA